MEIPFFFLGTPSGHDVEFHTYSWLEVLAQWKQGVRYPRWAAMAHFAYGEPRFVFYPPASWTLGAALSALLPWTNVADVYVWLALVAAGVSMFLLARQWLDRRSAIFAATFYAVNPYHLVIVYWRSALAELLASCLLPVLVLLILRAAEGRRVTVPLGLVLAAAWLTNAPAAVMIHYSLVLLVLVIAWRQGSPRILASAGLAVGLGAALAAFYLFPAIYEQHWVNIAEAVSAGSRPQDNFLFIHTTDADHDRFNRIISLVAVATMLVTLGAAWGARKLRDIERDLWPALLSWAIACSVLMFSVSGLLWNYLPKLRFMQFPWRWMLCLSMIVSLLLASGVKRWWARAVVCFAMLLVLAFSWQRVQAPWWDQAADLREMQDNMASGEGYEGTDEYTPVGADSAAIDKDARRVTVDGPEHAAIRVLQWNAMSKTLVANMSAPSRLALRLFSYPAWRVEVNGHVVQTSTREGTGQMLVPVEAGMNRVQINFARTWDRNVGKWITLVVVVCIGLWKLLERNLLLSFFRAASSPRILKQRILIATSNSGKLRDFAGAAAHAGVEVADIPNFASLPAVVEDGLTFEANAMKKAEAYSRYVQGEIVLADDSGLEVDALKGAPGVHSARYAADDPHEAEANTDDDANNAKLLRELKGVPPQLRTGRFVCVLVAALDGKTLATFRGMAEGVILDVPRGSNGFGYDPLFYFPQIHKAFAELTAQEKARYSHRGEAFRKFLAWYGEQRQ